MAYMPPHPPSVSGNWLTLADAVKYLGYTRQHVYSLLQRGIIRGVKGRDRRWWFTKYTLAAGNGILGWDRANKRWRPVVGRGRNKHFAPWDTEEDHKLAKRESGTPGE